jgi:hypothetical protein
MTTATMDEFDLDIRLDVAQIQSGGKDIAATASGTNVWCCSDACSDNCPPTSRQITCV